MKKIKVIYIAGYGRSGSTLVDQIIGNQLNMFSGGEIRHFWKRGLIENQLCGCSLPINNCPVWTSIISKINKRTKSNVRNVEVAKEVFSIKRKVDRVRYIPNMLFGSTRSKQFKENYNIFREYIKALYTSIDDTIENEFIIDSSKDPSYLYLLNSMDFIDLHVVHLIRDPRAVTYSWQRKKVRTEIHWEKQEMPRLSILRSTFDWTFNNLLVSMLPLGKNRKAQLKYEDFIESPNESIRKVFENFNIIGENKIISDEIELNENHTVSGNPSRFKKGKVVLKNDFEWKYKMNVFKRSVVTFITIPFLITYKFYKSK